MVILRRRGGLGGIYRLVVTDDPRGEGEFGEGQVRIGGGGDKGIAMVRRQY